MAPDLLALDLQNAQDLEGQVAALGQQAAQQMLGADLGRPQGPRLLHRQLDHRTGTGGEVRETCGQVVDVGGVQRRLTDGGDPPYGLLQGSLADGRDRHSRLLHRLGQFVGQVDIDLRHDASPMGLLKGYNPFITPEGVRLSSALPGVTRLFSLERSRPGVWAVDFVISWRGGGKTETAARIAGDINKIIESAGRCRGRPSGQGRQRVALVRNRATFGVGAAPLTESQASLLRPAKAMSLWALAGVRSWELLRTG